MEKKSKESFEETLMSLESLVDELESGKLSLDESISKFESGVKLYKSCKKSLGQAERKIKVLTDSLKEENLD